MRVDPNYWGAAAAANEPLNNALQAAKRDVELDKQKDTAITTNDLKSGKVAGASFAYLGPKTVENLKGIPCVVIQKMNEVYGSTAGAWWIYMDQQHEPFNNRSVRAAVAHAINYDRIIQLGFGGNAVQWVGPVPPGYPNYNPASLAPYTYNLALARQYMNSSRWPLASGGYTTPLKYAYVDLGDWAEVATLLQDDLAKIGITLVPTPITLANLYEEQAKTGGVCTTDTTTNGGPFHIGQEFYTSDYIAPDDWTFNNALSSGSANVCASRYNNPVVDDLVTRAAGETNPVVQKQQYTRMTQLMYDNYTNVWLVTPTQFSVYNQLLKGVVPNPMGSALPFTMLFNTEYT
jgi:peptide/nickel transport system substrate-binding protein